jgi:hypothetical protein
MILVVFEKSKTKMDATAFVSFALRKCIFRQSNQKKSTFCQFFILARLLSFNNGQINNVYSYFVLFIIRQKIMIKLKINTVWLLRFCFFFPFLFISSHSLSSL